MNTKTSKWYECVISYKPDTKGVNDKKLLYVTVDALKFSDAERKAEEWFSEYYTGDYDVRKIKISSYSDVRWSENRCADKWYTVKVDCITLDEKSMKEKRSSSVTLVNGSSSENALENMKKMMRGWANNWQIVAVKETKIIDVL